MIALGVLLFIAGLYTGRYLARCKDDKETTVESDKPAQPDTPALAETPPPPKQKLFELKDAVEGKSDRIHRPQDLHDWPEFEQAVALLAGPDFSSADCLAYVPTEGYVLSCMALSALARREEKVYGEAAKLSSRLGRYSMHYLLVYLDGSDGADTAALFLMHSDGWWWWRDEDALCKQLQAYLSRIAAAHPAAPDAALLTDADSERLQDTLNLMEQLQVNGLDAWRAAIKAQLDVKRAPEVLRTIGQVMTSTADPDYVPQPEDEELAEALVSKLEATPRRSQIVCAEHGTGKTTLINRVARELIDRGWLVFEASASNVLAGQSYVGELEGRINTMLEILSQPKRLWIIPDFPDLLHKGSHSHDPRGILDMIMPALERGELLILGEAAPKTFAHVLSARPSLRNTLDTINLLPLSPVDTADLARNWLAARQHEQTDTSVADESLVDEAIQLAAQYLPEQTMPGRVIGLIKAAYRHACAQKPPQLPLTRNSLISTLATISGLPQSVLDDDARLEIDTLRRFFTSRVIGQDEAVDCLVDRISMLKAGLIDPKRPIGVFLFAGPTGTGKTEIAKTLAECLFGGSERMIRLDMSEYQSEDAYWRLIAADNKGESRSLVTRIREQPFSVVLLDEFEKAHPKIWDLFLQVFDDGRLSDVNGASADLRHTLIILTSNLGSTISRDGGPGFVASGGDFSRSMVEKNLYQTFRREFINRLDRVIVFNPLSRAVMRDILHKELRQVLTRRGLRNRDWAVEWEPSAIEFLLDKGFTPDLGARPLRRAIEHHLLAPLSRTIVEQRAPAGDQFLFVRSANGKLEVEFIDPDATQGPALQADSTHPALKSLVYNPLTTPATLDSLRAAAAALHDTLNSADWVNARQQAYDAMAHSEFWQSTDRHQVLDRIERTDRIESALDAAGRLQVRLDRQGASPQLVQSLAQLLWLIELAVDDLLSELPQDACLILSTDSNDPGSAEREWWQRLLRMYLAWADRRRMQVQIHEQNTQTCRARLSVSGFAALHLLADENGLHVLEDDNDPPNRIRVRVQVCADGQALAEGEFEARICRRYREGASALARDNVKGWRSGRLDRVLAGEFDVVE